MFYRSSPRRRPKGVASSDPKFGSPYEELSHNLDRLEHLANKVHKSNAELHQLAPKTPAAKPRRNTIASSLKKLRRRHSNSDDECDDVTLPSITVTPNKGARRRRFRKEPDADFVHVDAEEEAEMVECIRRVAELVVIGERSAASAEDKREQNRAELGFEADQEGKLNDVSLETGKFIALFEQFFERNGLALIVGIVTGAFFSLPSDQDADNSYSSEDFSAEFEADENGRMFLPPLTVATQAIQSISILVQNVSRATSLYFILSNNHVNQLIKFPLEHYQAAERKMSEHQIISPRRHGSPELAELTTHFITFLKSLALRMNAETLQFFLTYPPDENLRNQPINPPSTYEYVDATKEGIDFDGVNLVPVSFPLYARTLEFCSAHQDSFVRLTAMNICLNTLRLAAVHISDYETGGKMTEIDLASPDGVLHNAKALPIRERLAIAQHVCAPSRVELLVSPIFTKLAQLWGMLEEQFRELDTLKSLEKASADGKRRLLIGKFNDIAANLQDELLLFEDVLKVGLTSLNEQAIEMMLATFVYPLLLQPILLYFQRSQISDEVLFADQLDNYQNGSNPASPESEKAFVSASAKSALFSLSTIFLFITHQPLLRILFGALFHPLAPDVIGETVTRSKADVAFIDGGNVVIRIDPTFEKDTHRTSKFQLSYLFGVRPGTTLVPSKEMPFSPGSDEEMCIFVLSPALAEILAADSASQGGLLNRTRLNPYRKAIFQCLALSHELSDLRPLAVLAIDTTVSAFDRSFISGTLFGMQLPDLMDSLPKLSSINCIDEIVEAFRRCIATVVPDSRGNWILHYDHIAAHALLRSFQGNNEVITASLAKMNERCCQAAAFLSDIPSNTKGLTFNMGFASSGVSQEEKHRDYAVDYMFHGREKKNGLSVVEELKVLRPEYRGNDGPSHNIDVSSQGSFDELCRRASMATPASHDSKMDSKGIAFASVRSWLRLDAFSNLLSILATGGKELDPSDNGIVVRKDCGVVQTGDRQTIYSPISARCNSILFDDVPEVNDPRTGTVVKFVGHAAIPCVCEAPPSSASLFSPEGAKVVSDGVTWQSLYLVLYGRFMILAEPERGSSAGDGRVVTCCSLERVTVEQDESPPDGQACARRLLITYDGTENSPTPGLFLRDETTAAVATTPFFPIHQWRSSLDCWFEDELAATHAYDVLDNRTKLARARRGKRICEYLAQGKNSAI